MWPWEEEPRSIAHGILDDETYDWVAVVRGMLETGGSPVVVDEPTLEEANALARETTGIDVDHTGSSGLAGLLHLARHGGLVPTRRSRSPSAASAALPTPRRPSPPTGRDIATRRREGHEELSWSRHPVAEGVLARRVLPGLPGRRRSPALRAGSPQHGPPEEQDAPHRVLPAQHADAPLPRGGHAPARRPRPRASPIRR